MAYRDLYIDIDRGELVTSSTDSTAAAMPLLVQGDTLPLRIWLLRGFSRLATAYENVAVDGLTLRVTIGEKGGDNELFTWQYTWTPSDDLAEPFFLGSLSLATEGIDDLLGEDKTAKATFEVKVLEGTPRTVLTKDITVHATVDDESELTVPEGLTPLSAEAALAMFLTRTIYGEVTLYNAETGYGVRLSCGPAGELQTDIVLPT